MKKKTRKQLNGKEVSTKGLYEQQYRTPHPLAWAKKINKAYSKVKEPKSKEDNTAGKNLLETSQLNEWLNKNTGVIEKTDREILRELILTTKSTECTCNIIFYTSIFLLVISFVSLVFTLFIFINH